MSHPMHPVLRTVADAYERELAGRDADWCQLHPFGNYTRWNAQQLVAHLVLTYTGTTTLLEQRLIKKRPTRAHSTFSQWMLQLVVLSLGRMPTGVPAPAHARPERLDWPPMTGAELSAKLRSALEQMDVVLEQCRHRFGIQRVASHFLFGPLRVDQWRRFHVVHGNHHLRQLRRIERYAEPVKNVQQVPALS